MRVFSVATRPAKEGLGWRQSARAGAAAHLAMVLSS